MVHCQHWCCLGKPSLASLAGILILTKSTHRQLSAQKFFASLPPTVPPIGIPSHPTERFGIWTTGTWCTVPYHTIIVLLYHCCVLVLVVYRVVIYHYQSTSRLPLLVLEQSRLPAVENDIVHLYSCRSSVSSASSL